MSDHTSAGHHPTDHPRGWSSVSWSMAAQATLHCLTGCAIGEVLGMVIGTALELHNAATVVLSVALAFVFGYALTMRGVLRAGVGLGTAVKVALAADTVSIDVPEQVRQARLLLARPAESVPSIARLLGISRTTLYKHVPELQQDGGRTALVEAVRSEALASYDATKLPRPDRDRALREDHHV